MPQILLAIGALLVASAACAQAEAPAGQEGGLQHDVVFEQYSPQSRSMEMLRRLLSPLSYAGMQQDLMRSNKALDERPVDLAQERFVVYVPAKPPPPAGYGLLVFIPPWPEARMPAGWGPVLDRYDTIYVSAARSGNDANTLGRRVPLAVIAEANIVSRYPVDPGRIYIGGFSGGSRVAMRVALSFPDVFHAAFLNAGSDPIGTGLDPLPPRELFTQFQESTRLVYVTGEQDTGASDEDRASGRSMRDWCVPDVEQEVTLRTGHEVASPQALAKALTRLAEHVRLEPDTKPACRASIERELTGKLAEVESRLAKGRREDARRLLLRIDARFGGLASPRSVELARQCDCGLLGP
jgi:hypothetical protein